MALVETRDLVKRFGALTAVDGITFSVDRGEVVGFLGPNGAGKSTAMKIISGFLEPTSGQAWIDGHNSQTDPIAARRRLGYLPEGAPAYSDMTVGAFLGFIAAMRGLHKVGAVNERELTKTTLRMLGKNAFPKVEAMSPDEIVAVRERRGISQAVLAAFMNVAVNTVSQWERGERRPTGAALKLLHVVKVRGLEVMR